jgi:anti-sigma B factor antagonist
VQTHRFTRHPQPALFSCACSHDGGVLTVSPAGELDLSTAPVLDTELRRVAGGSTDVVVDLRDVSFIDSTGVHVLLRWAGESARRGRAFRVIPGSERVELVFALTGVLETLGVERHRSVV